MTGKIAVARDNIIVFPLVFKYIIDDMSIKQIDDNILSKLFIPRIGGSSLEIFMTVTATCFSRRCSSSRSCGDSLFFCLRPGLGRFNGHVAPTPALDQLLGVAEHLAVS